MRKKCICEYDGSAYSGWQWQGNASSVQEKIEKALSTLYGGQEICVHCAGRTDARVHALGQVFHFDEPHEHASDTITSALNSLLPKDITILSTWDVGPDFHARKSAITKTYLYRILNRPVRPALERERAWHRRTPIISEKLEEILSPLLGKHDFASFCVTRSLKENTVRTILKISVRKKGDIIELRYTGDGFLHKMIRIITGTAVELTISGKEPQDMIRILQAGDRRQALVTAPAQGLFLEEVYYS